MNPFFSWLGGQVAGANSLEQKNQTSGLVALHSTAIANWSWGATGSTENGYCKNPIVYRCVRMISQAAASVPFKVIEKRMDCNEHPLLSLLHNPNEFQSCTELMERVYSHLLISGNAFIMRLKLVRSIKQLFPLDPAKVSIIRGHDGWPQFFEYKNTNKTQRFD